MRSSIIWLGLLTGVHAMAITKINPDFFRNVILQKDFQKAIQSGQFKKGQFYRKGHGEGNGGDHIRATYIRIGQAVIGFLLETEQGLSLLSEFELKIESLENTLMTEKIQVVDQTLVDNTFSIVDAIGIPDMVLLNREAWLSHFERERDIYYLVFHEMLRSAAVNDDDYLISKSLMLFPKSRRLRTRLAPLFPLIEEQILANVFDPKDIKLNGKGCQLNQQHGVEFDFENNILEIKPQAYFVFAGKQTGRTLRRSACALSAPFKAPTGQRLVISQIDLSGKIHLLPQASVRLSFEAFIAGDQGEVQSLVKENISDEDLLGRVLLREGQVFVSECEAEGILRMNTSALLKNKALKASHVLVEGFKVYLALQACHEDSSIEKRKDL